MSQADRAARLLAQDGRTFAEEAGVPVAKGTPSALWQLLLLSHLLSSRISAELGVRAARELRRAFPTAERLAGASHDDVHAALDRGDYLRKHRTATMLRDTAAHCLERWEGDLRRLRAEAGEADDPAAEADALLQEFSGIGPVGAEVFLREVQVAWTELRPYAGSRALAQARAARLPTDPARLAALVDEDDVARLMAALVRRGLSR